MQRHHQKGKQPGLNLVSLMDIFTILVFFLLVNSSSSEQLPNAKQLVLPDSVAEAAPKETLTIMVTRSDIIVQGRKVASVSEVLAEPDKNIQALADELKFQAGDIELEAGDEGRSVTILADENTPYEVVSKVLSTCQQSSYTNISFAANQKAKRAS